MIVEQLQPGLYYLIVIHCYRKTKQYRNNQETRSKDIELKKYINKHQRPDRYRRYADKHTAAGLEGKSDSA
jgi:hypothetical protein